MIIDKNLCDGCGKCAAECPKTAIVKDGAGKYNIGVELCNNCEDMLDIECIRFCGEKAITANDGAVPEFDTTCRVRSEHLLWLMSIMGAKNNGLYPVGSGNWDLFRKIICHAYLDPDFQVRLTKNFDDTCTGCDGKQRKGHPEECGVNDGLCFKRLGVEPGTVMKLWDAVKLVEDKFSIPFIKEHNLISGAYLDCFIASVPHDAKVLTNEI